MREPNGTILSQLVKRYGSKELWSVQLAVVSLPIYVLASLAFDAVRVSDFSNSWVGIGLITYLEVVLLGLMVRGFAPKSWWQSKRAALINLGLVGAIGSIKHATVAILAIALGLESQIDWFMRLFGGALLAISITLVFVAIAGSRLEHSATMAQLQKTQNELLGFRDNALAIANQQSEDLIAETQSVIEPKLTKIEKLLIEQQQVMLAVSELRDLIRQDIRPLSHDLQKRASQLSLKSDPETHKMTVKSRVPEKIHLHRTLYPFGSWGFVALIQAWFVYMLYGPNPIWWSLLATIPLLITTYLTKRSYQKSSAVTRGHGFRVLTGLVLMNTLATVTIYSQILDLTDFFVVMVISVLLINSASIFGAAYVTVIDADRARLERDMEAVNNSLLLETKRFEQELWGNQKRWGYTLHGTVQATLTAAVTRLTAQEEVDQAMLGLVSRDLERVRQAIGTAPKISIDLKKAFAELQETWRGICSVSFEVSAEAWKSLKSNENAKLCINEIVKEAVSNARRHGAAKNIKVNIEDGDSGVLFVKITNDGTPISSKSARSLSSNSGLGSRMLNEICLDWGLDSNQMAGKTTLSLTVPVGS